MKKIYILILTIALFSLKVNAQLPTYNWAFNVGSAGGGDNGRSISADASGNSYVTGFFQSTADFDPSAGVQNLTANSLDMFLAKYDASGNIVWAFNCGVAGNPTYGNSVKVDGAGNVIVVGTFKGIVDFDPSISTYTLNNGNTIAVTYVAKYSSAGALIWAFKLPPEDVWSVTTDNLNNVILTGQTNGGGSYDMDPSAAVANITWGGTGYNVFVAKYTSAGAYVWAFDIFATTNDDLAQSVSCDPSNNIYLTGYSKGVTDFDPSAGVANPPQIGTQDIFCAKYNSAGTYQWVFRVGASGQTCAGNSIKADASGVVVTGLFGGTPDFNPGIGIANLTSAGNSDIFVAKYDAAANYQWAFKVGSPTFDAGYSITTDATGNVYLTGQYTGTADFDPGVGVSNSTAVGQNDIFLAGYTGAGNYLWSFGLGSAANEQGTGITTDASGNILTTGWFTGTIDFDPSASVANYTDNGSGDIYVAKYCSALSTPGAISGNTNICSGSVNTYSVAVVAGATSYTWSLPGGWTGSSSTNTISTTAGASSGNVAVTASNACGTSPAQTLSVTVNTIPATPGAISGNITICSGSANTYSIAAVAGATAYTWVKPAGWAGASTTNIINTTASATSGNITVSASNACGTSAVQTLSVTVNVTPATPGTISGNVTICSGSANTYSVASVAGATSYNWLYPGGWSGASATNIINTTSSATSGNVSVSASNACGTSAIKTLSVTVNSIPATPGAISGLATLCSGAAVSNYSIASVAGATSYTWSLAGGWSGASSTNIISATPGASGTFSITATNACGTSAAQTLSVTVNITPTITVNSGTICSGQSFTITPSGANTYTIQGGSATVSPGTTTSYTVMGTSAQGCVSSSPATSNVTVSATPTITMAGGAICPGNSFTLNPSGASTYTFSSGPVVSPSSTTSYTVSGTSAAGCVSGQTVATVTVAGTLTVTIAGSNTVCNGTSLNLVAGGATTYTWNTGATTTTITPTPTVNTTYSVTGASGSCSNTAMFSVTVNPTPTVSAVTSTSLICVGQSATLTASGANTYTWNPGGAGTSITVSPTVTATYTVTGTNASGCTNVSIITQNVSGCVGISQYSNLNTQISVYPNPFTNKFTVVSDVKETPIQIFNSLGELIYKSKTENGKAEIDLKDQANGIYFVKIGSVTKKIIKE